MKMTLNMSHIILGSSGVNSLASLPTVIYWSALRQFCSTCAEQRQLRHLTPAPSPEHSQAPSWDWPCDTADTKHSSSTKGVLTFTPSVLQDKRNGKTVQSIAASASLLFPPHHYITFRPQAWNCSCTSLAQDKLFFAFWKIQSARKKSM